jgi:hypothetical protein
MKNILLILVLTMFLITCNDDIKIIETEKEYIVDSVVYHRVGGDNTLQTTPYWKLYFKGEKIGVTSYRGYEIGDTIKLITKKIIKKTDDK